MSKGRPSASVIQPNVRSKPKYCIPTAVPANNVDKTQKKKLRDVVMWSPWGTSTPGSRIKRSIVGVWPTRPSAAHCSHLRWQQVPGQFERDAADSVNSRSKSPIPPRALQRSIALVGTLLVLPIAAHVALAAEAANREPIVTVEPLTLFQDQQIAGCGFRASIPVDGQTVTASVTAYRDGLETVFAVSAHWPDTSGAPLTLDTLRLVTSSHDTTKDFPKPAAVASGLFEMRARLEGFSGASFVQGMMVGGGTFEVAAKGGRTVSIALPSPMPQNIRAAYLNCAGDLFRPEN